MLVLAGMLLATAASAQKEQWLQYHTSREGRGYRGLQLTTNPPANIALPKLNAQPYFAHWTTPMDPKGRWICLDRTAKPVLTTSSMSTAKAMADWMTKRPLKANRMEQYNAYFEPVRVVFKGEDGPITYHLVFQFMKYDSGSRSPSQVYLTVRSGGYYEGLVDLGGKKKRIELLDNNVNGTFDDQKSNLGDSDCVAVEGDKVGQRYLGKLLEVDDQIYRLEVARDGAFLKLQKAEDLTFGEVRVPETISEFVAFGPNGHFVRKPVKGEFKLPAGKYQIHEWNITRKDAKGSSWQLSGRDFPDSARFNASDSKPVTLDIGEPVRALMRQNESTNQVAFDLSFKGRLNETISIQKGNQNPPGPRLTLASLDGSYRVTNTFEFG